MILLIADGHKLFSDAAAYVEQHSTENTITCVSVDEIENYLIHNGSRILQTPYHEPDLCVIASYYDGTLPCVLNDYITTASHQNHPIITGTIWKHVLPCVSAKEKHINARGAYSSADCKKEDSLYDLFCLLRSYFFETCIVPIYISLRNHNTQNRMKTLFECVALLAELHQKNIAILQSVAHKQNSAIHNDENTMQNHFVRSLCYDAIESMLQLAQAVAQRLRFTHQMSERLKKHALRASFFSVHMTRDTLVSYLQTSIEIPKTKAQVKIVFATLIDMLKAIEEVLL